MGLVIQCLGLLLVLAVAEDVFFTVLFPGSGHGMLRRPLSALVWRGFRIVGSRLRADRRRRLLSASGPVEVAATLLMWLALLAVGWAAVYRPALGEGIALNGAPADWGTALYVSGMSLTTLGTGDVTPASTAYRLFNTVEAATGFAAISMAVTYFLSIYGALVKRRTQADALHHRSRDTGDAAMLLAGVSQEPSSAAADVRSFAQYVQSTYETHRSYPVLRYFHVDRVEQAIPRVLLLALDLVALLRSAVEPAAYAALLRSPVLDELNGAASQLLEELLPDCADQALTDAEEMSCRRRFRRAVALLAQQDIAVRENHAAEDRYVELRREWDHRLRALSGAMLYDWHEVEPS